MKNHLEFTELMHRKNITIKPLKKYSFNGAHLKMTAPIHQKILRKILLDNLG